MSKSNRIAVAATAIALATMVCSPAWADRGDRHGGHGHGDGGWGWGLGLLLGTAILIEATQPRPVYPAYYPAPVYGPQPIYVQPSAVVEYPADYAVGVPPAQPSAVAQQAWWYYCSSAAGYYPYVRNCPEGWMPVSPTPPSQ